MLDLHSVGDEIFTKSTDMDSDIFEFYCGAIIATIATLNATIVNKLDVKTQEYSFHLFH